MSIDISGGMIVGESGYRFNPPDDYDGTLELWADEVGLDSMSERFDADCTQTVYGFTVPDVAVSDIEHEWLADVQEKAQQFKALTGVDARLIGTQDVY
ncbi:hypothetical protein [Endozoicomonas sp. SCSIO W0465]|uniref:hypothetical protein n=1 Tax=Endozoicomonas sp. SCSIO W0465 TaxID=2918516 RepID=UPI0020762C75|nr:hypothetical protein [Endozoicomonas sp. SCSIO W0465]USE39215.1 hypothetical protein MJO57_14280 [Endozoicomonas sp. SCSIO W0465]